MLNSPRHPRANGQVERIHQPILTELITSIQTPEHRDWDARMKDIERNLNTAKSKTTGMAPFHLLYGFIPRFNDGIARHLADPEQLNRYENPVELQTKARERIEQAQKVYKLHFDQKRYEPVPYSVGEVVVVRRAPKQTGDSKKTQLRYKGPFVVTKVVGGNTYRIESLCDRAFISTAHADQLKSYFSHEDDSVEADLSECDDDHLVRRSNRHRQAPSRYDDYV